MPDSPKNDSSRVTLEQLLQLKRNERPAPEFWENFDRELRRRQLAAVVTAEPWFFRWGRAFFTGLRRLAPVGVAAGALVIGFVVVQQRRGPVLAPVQTAAAEPETQLVVTLPEEHVAPAVNVVAAPKASSVAPALRAPSHYAMQELMPAALPTRSFVTVAAPQTLSVTGDDSGIYSINALTTTPAGRSQYQPVPVSF